MQVQYSVKGSAQCRFICLEKRAWVGVCVRVCVYARPHAHAHVHLVMSDSLRPRGPQPARLLCPLEFSRQEYWRRLPFPTPDPGIKPASPGSPAVTRIFFSTEPAGKPLFRGSSLQNHEKQKSGEKFDTDHKHTALLLLLPHLQGNLEILRLRTNM